MKSTLKKKSKLRQLSKTNKHKKTINTNKNKNKKPKKTKPTYDHTLNKSQNAITYKWIDNVTIGVKTFMRVECLYKCLHSIRKYYPTVKILVADDSLSEIKNLNIRICEKFNAEHLNLQEDSGLSHGRNQMVKNTKTKYYVTIDDDSVFLSKTKLKIFYDFLERKTKYDMIGGKCKGRPAYLCRYSHLRKMKNGDLHIYLWPHPISDIKNNNCRAVQTNRMQNFFMAKTDFLVKNPWDEQLKLGEHNNFFVRAWKNKSLLAWTDKVTLGEKRTQNNLYKLFRSRKRDFEPTSEKTTGKCIKLNRYVKYNPNLTRKKINSIIDNNYKKPVTKRQKSKPRDMNKIISKEMIHLYATNIEKKLGLSLT